MDPASLAGLALSAAAAAQQLFYCGLRIYRRVQKEQELNLLLHDLKIFELDHERDKLDNIIKLAQPVLASPIIKQDDKHRLEQTWERIKKKMIRTDELLDEMIKNSSVWNTRARHKARDELRDMGSTKAFSGLLTGFQADVFTLRHLLGDGSSHFLSVGDFNHIDKGHRIVGATPGLFLGEGRLTKPRYGIPSGRRWFLCESKPYQKSDREEVEANVTILCQNLQRAQPDSGILQLLGFREETDPANSAFELIFCNQFVGELPPTLADFLKAHPSKPTLNFRVNLCYQPAAAVHQTHSLGLVHKNVRPENILMFPSKTPVVTADEDIPGLSLCGWQYARQVEQGVTRLEGEVTLQRKIYQHPERQLPIADHEYSMAHDIYSLGVCALEILRWKSLIETDEQLNGAISVSSDFIHAFESLDLTADAADGADRYTKYPRKNKKVLIEISKTDIPVEAGTKMAHIVHGFLTCLDKKDRGSDDNPDQYVLSNEGDRRTVAMHFMDMELKDLRGILSLT